MREGVGVVVEDYDDARMIGSIGRENKSSEQRFKKYFTNIYLNLNWLSLSLHGHGL